MSENITDYITLSLIGHKEIIKFGTPQYSKPGEKLLK